ncbi:F-box/kelch-repeat protein At3g23880-like [Papaver somniferum]|uniref:F-box/kelch-repeat protein At3g23880-like n=1 Tax=Papaver somniferum TaxID=3469 RepID=UPI000E6F602A|nr:F-box/kelch-repeat protein At3g23880-like [Papaver somniferum]
MSSSSIPVLDVGHQTKKRKPETLKETDVELCKKLPEDLLLENIATRLPDRTLARYSCLSKLCTILFSMMRVSPHITLLQSHKKLVFNHLNASSRSGFQKAYIFNLQRKDSDKNIDDYDGCHDDDHVVFLDYKLSMFLNVKTVHELVGYCNGLACFKPLLHSDDGHSLVTIVNPATGETLALMYCDPTISTGGEYLCHGFGFDSSSQEYKVVIIFTTRTTNKEKEDEQLFVCIVITSGTNLWRKIVLRLLKSYYYHLLIGEEW